MPLDNNQLSDRQHLQQMAQGLTEDCPDMREMARKVAMDVLVKYHIGALDPDTVYLHRFKEAIGSDRTYTGFRYLEHPYASLTLPQLVIHRFDPDDQDNADTLIYRCGFYTDGPEKGVYNERDEVRLLPMDVLTYFWEVDFATNFKNQLSAFWATRKAEFRTLAKVNFLSKVLEVCARQPGSALAKCCAQASQALVGGQHWPPTLAQLQEEVTPAEDIRLCALDIGGHVATDILRVDMKDGRQLLYLPGEVDALQLFQSKDEMFWWLLNHNNHADNRARFMAHFSLDDRDEGDSSVGLNHLIDVLYESWGRSDYSGLNSQDLRIEGDAFSWLRDKAHQRMLDDAHYALRSNGDLRKQMWVGYLRAFAKVFGPMAAVDWPVALAVVGAGLAETGLNIDQAINGHTTRERRAGVTGAIFAAINTLFNATLLLATPGKLPELGEAAEAGAGETGVEAEKPETATDEAEPGSDAATTADLLNWVPKPFQPGETWELLAPFETNVILAGEPGSGSLEGIYTQDGQFYVLIDEQPYQVRHVHELKTWVIVDPENPFSFYKTQAIRRDADGLWYPLERGGLKGGMLSRMKAWGWRSPGGKLPPLAQSPYEIPEPTRPLLKHLEDRTLSGVMVSTSDPEQWEATALFRATRDRLAADAIAFMAAPEIPARPQIPEMAPGDTARIALQKIYENSNGLVIGEAHSALGSKRLLIENMGLLRKMKVKTLYMEHYLTDFQQADLDTFNRTGRMSEELDSYIKAQDRGHRIDPTSRYTFRQVLVEAQKHDVRIQSIDCMASYRQAWEVSPPENARLAMMNFYAHRVIEADQALRGPGRWVALVGNSHANNLSGVTGLAETEGAIGLRVEDIPLGRADIFEADSGAELPDEHGSVTKIRSDIRLRASVAPRSSGIKDFEAMLTHPGDYSIEQIADKEYVVSRGRDMSLRRTLIQKDGQYIYVERPEWKSIHQRRLPQLSDLRMALRMRGMLYKQA